MSPGPRAGRPGLSSVPVQSLGPALWVSGQTSAPSVVGGPICAMSEVREGSEVVACASPEASIPRCPLLQATVGGCLMRRHPTLPDSPAVGNKVRNPEFAVQCPDFYQVAKNSNFYKTLWGPKKHAGEPRGPGPRTLCLRASDWRISDI